MSLVQATRDVKLDRARVHIQALKQWGPNGLTRQKLESLPNILASRLSGNILSTTRLLINGFPGERVHELNAGIHPAMYAEAQANGIDPLELNHAWDVHGLRPTVKYNTNFQEENAVNLPGQTLSFSTEVPGDLPQWLRSRRAGATRDQVEEATTRLKPYSQTFEDEYGLSRVPLHIYARAIASGASHRHFINMINTTDSLYQGSPRPEQEKVNGRRDVLNRWARYCELGADPQDATQILPTFLKRGSNGLAEIGNRDEHFINALRKGIPSGDYLDAVNKGYNPQKYVEARETLSHKKALSHLSNFSSTEDLFGL